ncbi:eukaryotic translation initiation factor 4E-2, putative [Entamoeba dispar SAW760]|uniref:Eukaryotic translation initiation factor 4E-2, putative n=1 Tax=Entamoeba dispar (strain ATCC PRA-260 / SAW760) TaxID=370354 RepID=B0EBP1_ENTDS|nr:eukaryotic translation initiation factor 4E-2, putative [Entamoeba dispar SAW760]EDR28053.1 eukaryotic translation initiation factor 4E-2, putative [Entamoeba dispar SAW760]|eukprot:EDR28053.1 eukaryotic translation initiation factor 4E-2, putative [Entamoeba dispar SAW760]
MNLILKIEMEHKLFSEWTFWFDGFSNKSTETYGSNIVSIGSFKTAEEFWGIYDAIPKLGTMENGSDVSLFKNGIKPIWEDTSNVGGGRIQTILTNTNNELCQQYWRDTILSLIGETIPSAYCINGAAFSVRQHNKIALWLDKSGKEHLNEISKKLRDIIPCDGTIIYYSHDPSVEPIVC